MAKRKRPVDSQSRLDRNVKEFAMARRLREELKRKLDHAQAALEETKAYQTVRKLYDQINEQSETIHLSDGEIRAAALNIYDETTTTTPHPGVTIINKTVVECEAEQLHSWCMDHLPQVMEVNTRIAHQVIKAMNPGQRPQFAVVEKIHSVRISRDNDLLSPPATLKISTTKSGKRRRAAKVA